MNDFKVLNERCLIDAEIHFHHLKKFYDDILKHF